MKIDIPKRKPNHFYVYNKNDKKYIDIKYISQNTIAEGYIQIVPTITPKKLINHFTVTFAFLPDYLWCKIKRIQGTDKYNIIKNGMTRYSIVETNQDEIMFNLYKEIHKIQPNANLIQNYIDNLDNSQHTSWLVIRGLNFIKTGFLFKPENITSFYKIDTNILLD